MPGSRMFKWKVSTLGGGGKKSKSPGGQKLNNATEEDRKQFAGEEGDFATQETNGFHDFMIQQPNQLVSTGYYPPLTNENHAMSPALSHRPLPHFEHGVNGYAMRPNGGLYHTVSMRHLSQQRQPLSDFTQENSYHDVSRMAMYDSSQYQLNTCQPSSVEMKSVLQPQIVRTDVERGSSPSENTQAQAYLAWANWQLRKKAGASNINDLSDLRDDRIMATLVQIVSSKPLIGLDSRPQTQAVCLINMERILAHLTKQRVKVTTITPHDLAGGNVKAIMKLIQSLAAFYKPHSVGSGRAPRGNSMQATPDLNQPSNRKLAELPPLALSNGQPSMGLTVRAVATLRRPPKQQPPGPGSSADVTVNELLQRKRLNLSAESLDRNKVNAQIQASLVRKAENSSQTVLSGPRQFQAANGPEQGQVPATPQVMRSARVDRKPSSVEKGRSGSMPPIKNISVPTQVTSVKRSESKVGPASSLLKRSESKVSEAAKRALQLNRSSSSATQKVPKMEEKSKSESLIRKTEEKKETQFKFWGTLGRGDKGRRRLPDSPKGENQEDEKPLDLSAEDSTIESGKAPSKSGSRGDLTLSPLDVRGEVEGSSNNTSPVNSDHEEHALLRSISAGNISRNKEFSVPKVDVYDRMEKKLHEVQKWLFQTVTMDPSVKLGHERTSGNGEEMANAPYDVVLRDLHTARKQLIELQSLLLSASSDVVQQQSTVTDSRGTTTTYPEDLDPYGLMKPTAIDNLKLSDVIPEDANPEKLRQALIKSALRQHRLNAEKVDLQKRLDEKEKQINELRKEVSSNSRIPEHTSMSLTSVGNGLSSVTPQMNRRSKGREELQIARDALTSLRGNFRSEDPNQHTIDTLEQCVSMLLERLTTSDYPSPVPAYRQAENMGTFRRPASGFQGSPETTKAVYFTERSLTPFLVVIQGRLGEVTLRDFKMALDRSTRFRFMFKTPDPEYGFVKQEIYEDDAVLPGFDGKVVAWLEEDCL